MDLKKWGIKRRQTRQVHTKAAATLPKTVWSIAIVWKMEKLINKIQINTVFNVNFTFLIYKKGNKLKHFPIFAPSFNFCKTFKNDIILQLT